MNVSRGLENIECALADVVGIGNERSGKVRQEFVSTKVFGRMRHPSYPERARMMRGWIYGWLRTHLPERAELTSNLFADLQRVPQRRGPAVENLTRASGCCHWPLGDGTVERPFSLAGATPG